MKYLASILFAVVIVLCTTNLCEATTGIYATGYGTQEQGMGGVGIAVGESALAPAGNPAGIAFSGDRLDVGGGLLVIKGGATENGVDYHATTGLVPMPEFGYVKSLSSSFVFGIASWAAGASMKYDRPFGNIPGNSNTDAEGVFVHVAPTVAYRFGPNLNNSIAFSVVGALSTIKVDGIEAQTGLPNQGRDWTPGYGFKIGWMSQITPQLSLGAFYASEIKYQPWEQYRDIFADGGRFNEPEQYGAGIAFRPTAKLLVAFDWVRFNYGNTHVLGNAINVSVPLGSVEGTGFGFANINAYRFGVQYEVNDRLTLRGGFELTNQLATAANTAIVFLVPSTLQRTFTAGATYRIDKRTEVSVAYAISPRVQVDGSRVSTGTNPYGQDNYVAFTYTKRF